MTQKKTIRKGSRGADVMTLQKLLNRLLSPSPNLSVDGDFGAQTVAAVKRFQVEAKLSVDGIVGRGTWFALSQATLPHFSNSLPQHLLADIAEQYIGTTETGNNLAGNSPKMLEIFKADDLVINGRTDGYPWCAAFVSLCVQKLCSQSPYYASLIPPREPSVQRFLNEWATRKNCLVFTPKDTFTKAMRGDIVVFTFSHIGIVTENKGSLISTIEGNTNAAGSREGTVVARKQRTTSIIKAYIRLPMMPVDYNDREMKFANYC